MFMSVGVGEIRSIQCALRPGAKEEEAAECSVYATKSVQ